VSKDASKKSRRMSNTGNISKRRRERNEKLRKMQNVRRKSKSSID